MSIVDTGGSGSQAPPREDRRSLKGAVYRISPDGVWDQLWESRDDSPYDLTFDRSGALIIGTGGKGKLYRLEGDPLRPTLLARAAAQQVTAFYKDPGGRLYYATANPGKLFRVSPERAARGTYESEVRDAQMVVDLGHDQLARHRGRPATRSSCSRAPATPKRPTTPGAPGRRRTPTRSGSPITSPKARYLQWRAVLTGKGDGPVLTSVTAAYLQRNLRPQVRTITVHPPGIVFQKPFTTGDPELAGFDDQSTPERKLAAAASAAAGHLVGARPPHLPEGTPDAGLEGGRRERRRPRLRRAVPPRGRGRVEDAAQEHQRHHPRLGHDDGAQRHLLREDRRVGRAVEPAGHRARRRARQRRLRGRQHAADDHGRHRPRRARPHHHPVRRQGRSLAGAARRVLAGRPAVARRVSGGRNRRLAARSTTSWRSTASSASAG